MVGIMSRNKRKPRDIQIVRALLRNRGIKLTRSFNKTTGRSYLEATPPGLKFYNLEQVIEAFGLRSKHISIPNQPNQEDTENVENEKIEEEK